jgi:hypothetical protein
MQHHPNKHPPRSHLLLEGRPYHRLPGAKECIALRPRLGREEFVGGHRQAQRVHHLRPAHQVAQVQHGRRAEGRQALHLHRHLQRGGGGGM